MVARRAALTAAIAGCHPVASAPIETSWRWERASSLPQPVTNNAVAAVASDRGPLLLSFLGLDSAKTHAGVGRWTFRWRAGDESWSRGADVPGTRGRLAATAQVVDGVVYVIGGYTVAEDGTEVSVPEVDVYDPTTDRWSSAPPMPTPVDDAVSGVWNETTIVLVSGWHEKDNVADVQLFDARSQAWVAATPIPGNPVFGHAGAVVDDTVVYCDGVAVDRSRAVAFVINPGCYAGTLSPEGRIAWRKTAAHPGPPRYRMAAGVWKGRVVFAGGSPHPYNYDGVGYDGRPSPATAEFYAYDPAEDAWATLAALPEPLMDHRGLVGDEGGLFLIGGMRADRGVSARVYRFSPG